MSLELELRKEQYRLEKRLKTVVNAIRELVDVAMESAAAKVVKKRKLSAKDLKAISQAAKKMWKNKLLNKKG